MGGVPPIEVVFVNMDPSAQLEDQVRRQAERMAAQVAGTASCHVLVEAVPRRRRGAYDILACALRFEFLVARSRPAIGPDRSASDRPAVPAGA